MTERLIGDYAIRDANGPVVRPGGVFLEGSERNNGATIGSGQHGKMTLKKPATTVRSTPDAVVKDELVSESSSVVYGVRYECKGDSPAVTVKSGGRLVLVGCHFTKEANIQTAASSYILVESGGRLSVTGCYFHNPQSSGFTINNAGVPANVVATGNILETTVLAPHNNVTVGVEIVL
jgi:hypothetical protein